ncbi:outer membrane transport energization protein ExbB [Hasllibacter halocynthiae]|uniref:Outer membrane transport energization protein ExbB n=1 Tax=Hasllibacter halocynthiae TaxID=595589 RepID=A0A2T0X1Q3_9RHOB|nr:MotA/TolQ/ExbB proton channel family protein [Hasllibacter halocynthiae]PRY92879.1 outer membrane transport energization protein ExbB [Hasllibacter halocynthiae]
MSGALDRLGAVYALGGPVVLLLLALSCVVLALALYKLWQFGAARVGRHGRLREALAAWDRGEGERARALAAESRSHLAPVVAAAMGPEGDPARLEAEAEASTGRLEGGFRLLDAIAQVAPLLGLFGTVLGMIDAFRALQAAGADVDPSALAGGIWVALLTTAAGLAVAMPATVLLTWLEGRVAGERALADLALARARAPRARAVA